MVLETRGSHITVYNRYLASIAALKIMGKHRHFGEIAELRRKTKDKGRLWLVSGVEGTYSVPQKPIKVKNTGAAERVVTQNAGEDWDFTLKCLGTSNLKEAVEFFLVGSGRQLGRRNGQDIGTQEGPWCAAVLVPRSMDNARTTIGGRHEGGGAREPWCLGSSGETGKEHQECRRNCVGPGRSPG